MSKGKKNSNRLWMIWELIPEYPEYRSVDEILALMPGYTRANVYNGLHTLHKEGKLHKEKNGMAVSYARMKDAKPPAYRGLKPPTLRYDGLPNEAPSEILERIETGALRLAEDASKLLDDIDKLRPLLITDKLTEELQSLRALQQSMKAQMAAFGGVGK